MFIHTSWLSFAMLLTSTLVQAQSLPDPTCFGQNAAGNATRGAGECAQFISAFCTSVATMNPQGTIRVGDSVHRCFNLDSTRRCDLIATNNFDRNINPSETNCVDVLNNVVNKCTNDLGGQGRAAPVAYGFEIDPNTGLCGHRGTLVGN